LLKRKEIKKIYFISILIFFAVFFTTAKLLEKPLTTGYCNNLLCSKAVRSSSLPEKLCRAVLPRTRIFRGVSLPIPGKEGEEIQLGTVAVSRSGIFILCQINGAGILENPPTTRWKQIDNGKFSEFDNPFTMQRDARALIDYYTDLAGYPEIKAHSIVIYTNPSLRFTHQKPRGVILAKEFPARLSGLEKRGRLSSAQVKAACNILSNADAY
jgi:hypothetical protein